MPGLAILLTLVLLLLANALCRAAWQSRPPSRILLSVKDREAGIEAAVRLLLWKNPRSEIYITDQGSQDDTPEILRRLAQDYPRVHISFPQ